MSTAFPHIFPIVALAALCFSIAGFFYLRNKYLTDFPGRSKITELQLEVAELAQAVVDLNDRFTRFQKREGMRDARSVKERNADILAEAQRIALEGAPDEAAAGTDKLALYRRLNH